MELNNRQENKLLKDDFDVNNEVDAIDEMTVLVQQRGPQQVNGFDCGVCVIANVEQAVAHFSSGAMSLFTSADKSAFSSATYTNRAMKSRRAVLEVALLQMGIDQRTSEEEPT
jgi:Ulp1 family protease